MIDVTAILNVHREGSLAIGSLRSMVASREAAEAAGLSVELIAVADSADRATLEILHGTAGLRIVETAFSDLGLARNAGVAAATGRYVAFLDGDDLWGPGWLLAAHRAAMSDQRAVIWHPEASLYFGPQRDPYWMIHPDMETVEGDWVSLGVRNQWTALSFASRETYVLVPYRHSDLAAGFGLEDWSWNAEVVAHGYLHKPVPGTVHLVRMRADSLVRRAAAVNALMTPSTLLRSRIGWAARVGSVGVAAGDATV